MDFFIKFAPSIKTSTQMRTTILSLILLTVAACMRAEVQLQNSEVNSQWRTKTISVKNGGQSPDVIKLLRAFNEALPTWVVGEVLKQADHPAKGTRQSGTASIYEDEYDFRILIDRKNGYADLASETDINQMSACIWRKDNGHRIFAVSLYEQHDMPQNLLCWYDYDPQTQTMKPEKSPLDDFQPDVKGAPISWDLPMKGTDFTITEYFIGITNITHVYKWDKEQFHLDHSELNDFEYKLAADSEAKERISKGRGWSHYCPIDLTDNGYPVMAFCNFYEGEIGDVMLIGEFKGDRVALGTSSQDGEKLNVFTLPDNRKGDKRVAIVHRDMAGGKFYNIMLGNLVQFLVCDLPDFAGGGENKVEITAGFGGPDETTDIINELGDWIDLSKFYRWSPFTIREGEEAP